MIHPRDQWFTVYRRLRVEVVKGKIVATRVFEPTPGEPAHVVHADAYHPDGSIRRKHAQRRFETGEVETACGRKITSRDIVISASPGEPCTECLEAQRLSTKEHEEASAHVDALHAEQRAFEEARAQVLEAEMQNAIEASDVPVEKVVEEVVAPTD
jgi:hypothetical protein